MTTIVINGSTRETGNTMVLASAVLLAIGGKKRFIHLKRMRIVPCTACGLCAAEGCCVLDKQDDMPAIRAALEHADRLLIASPLHFSSFTAPMIAVFSRLQPAWNHSRSAGRATSAKSGDAAVVLTGGRLYPNMFKAVRIVANAVFLTLGWRFAGMVAAPRTDAIPVASNAEALRRAANLGQKMRSRPPRREASRLNHFERIPPSGSVDPEP